MSAPLSSSEQSQIQAVDNQLAQYIKQVQDGTAKPSDLTQIHNALMNLATNPRIPAEVQQSLQQVLTKLKGAPASASSLASLQTAKSQVDSLLTATAPPVQSQVQAASTQLAQYIKQVQNGTAQPSGLTQVQNVLMSVATHPATPAPVQQSLKQTLNQLTQTPTPESSLPVLQSAKFQVDNVLSDMGVETATDDVGGGELGGGGSGESEG